jgi:hypothetical protein
MNNITKIAANHLAIVNETPEINPNAPATIATIKKIIAQTNPVPSLFFV